MKKFKSLTISVEAEQHLRMYAGIRTVEKKQYTSLSEVIIELVNKATK